METWKDIEGYEGLYQVSTLGRVKSLAKSRWSSYHEVVMNFSEKIRVPKPTKKGYVKVTFYKDGQKEQFAVHRLVAEAFVPNPENKPQVDHKDNNRSNNVKENLRWATSQENNRGRMAKKRSLGGEILKYRGVTKFRQKRIDGSWRRYSKPYMAQLWDGEKNLGLGYYKTQEEAAKAWDKKAKEIFGEHARLNFLPPEDYVGHYSI